MLPCMPRIAKNHWRFAMKVIANIGLAALLALSIATPVFADNISVGSKSKPFTTKTLFDQIYREIR
jgi:hypothetical protein